MNVLSRKEAAATLGISVAAIDNLRRAGKIAFIQYVPNGKVFFSEQDITEFVAQSHHPASPVPPAITYRRQRTRL